MSSSILQARDFCGLGLHIVRSGCPETATAPEPPSTNCQTSNPGSPIANSRTLRIKAKANAASPGIPNNPPTTMYPPSRTPRAPGTRHRTVCTPCPTLSRMSALSKLGRHPDGMKPHPDLDRTDHKRKHCYRRTRRDRTLSRINFSKSLVNFATLSGK
jgi:hypothetical protein